MTDIGRRHCNLVAGIVLMMMMVMIIMVIMMIPIVVPLVGIVTDISAVHFLKA